MTEILKRDNNPGLSQNLEEDAELDNKLTAEWVTPHNIHPLSLSPPTVFLLMSILNGRLQKEAWK